MYLGIDILLTPTHSLYVSEVNVGLPGGATEFDRAHRTYHGRSSGIFETIERTSRSVYGYTFPDYLDSLPYLKSLKAFKIWLDGKGPFPDRFHPGLRLEDKWVQHGLIRKIAPVARTVPFDVENDRETSKFLQGRQKVVLKRRYGRGGRGLRILDPSVAVRGREDFEALVSPCSLKDYVLQEYVESRLGEYALSIRAVAFGGRFLCMYANLAKREISNHGILFFVKGGDNVIIEGGEPPEVVTFDQKSWEAEVWFGPNDPAYLHHNLYEDDVARGALILPGTLLEKIQNLAVRIERLYEALDLPSLPQACFED